MSGIKAIISDHFKIFIRDVLYKQLNKINGGKCFGDKGIVLMLIVMEGHVITIVGINPGKGNDGASKIAADIFDNGIRVTEIGFGINIKAIFVFMVNMGFGLSKRRADTFFHLIQKYSLKRFTEVGIVEIINSTPEAIIGITALCKETMDVGIPLKRASKSMEDTDKTRDKIFGFIEGEKKMLNDIRNCFKEAVKEGTVIKEKLTEGLVNGEDKVSVGTIDEFEGHSSRPVRGIFGTAGRTEFRVAAERDKFKIAAGRAPIHSTTIRGVTAAYDFINVFHDNRSGF